MTFFIGILKGAIIGISSILPGISGGVLCVILEVYQPLMAFLAHPIASFRKNVSLLTPLLIGWVMGVLLLSRAVSYLFSVYEIQAIFVFAGLVVGTLPSLFQEAGSKGRPHGVWRFTFVAAILAGGWMFLLTQQGSFTPSYTVLWWMLCGILWGLGIILPGLSPSSLFLFLNTYPQMTAGIGMFDLAVVVPMVATLIATVVLLARTMQYLLSHWYAQVMYVIMGIVLASTLGILIVNMQAGLASVFSCLLCFIVGCAVAFGMELLSDKITPSGK